MFVDKETRNRIWDLGHSVEWLTDSNANGRRELKSLEAKVNSLIAYLGLEAIEIPEHRVDKQYKFMPLDKGVKSKGKGGYNDPGTDSSVTGQVV